jgi:hypothetical protein
MGGSTTIQMVEMGTQKSLANGHNPLNYFVHQAKSFFYKTFVLFHLKKEIDNHRNE